MIYMEHMLTEYPKAQMEYDAPRARFRVWGITTRAPLTVTITAISGNVIAVSNPVLIPAG